MATASGGFVVEVGDYDIFADEAHKLGFGAMGIVYSGRNRFNHKLNVAGKKITIEAEFFDDGDYQHESNMLLHTIPPHENIIKIYKFTTIPYQNRRGKAMMDLWIVMEYVELGNLKEYAESEALTLAQKLDIISQCVLAVNHLHQCRPEPIAHRDIKPENFVITKQKDRVVVKLVDFGYARTVQRVSGHSVTMVSLAGSRSYQAPEQIYPKKGVFPHGKSVDLFSLALTILAVLDSSKGKAMVPFLLDGHSLGYAMWQMMSQHGAAWSNFVPNIDKPEDGAVERAIKKILRKMLQTQPIDRIGITEVMERLSAVRRQLTETDPTAAASTPLADKDVEMDDAVGAMSSLGIRDDDMDASPSLNILPVPMAVHQLGFKASGRVGFGYHGEILLSQENTRRCTLFKYRENKYVRCKTITLPVSMDSSCYKAMSRHGDMFFQQSKDTPTFWCSSDGTLLTTLQHKGRLLDSVDDTLMYRRGSYDKGYIEVHDFSRGVASRGGTAKSQSQTSLPVIVLKPTQREWHEGLSVCRLEDQYIVTEWASCSMNIFRTNGEHFRSIDLSYPAYQHSVTSWAGYIVVVPEESIGLDIYTKNGEIVDYNMQTELRLDNYSSDYDNDAAACGGAAAKDKGPYIQGICCDKDEVLHVCVGGDNYIKYLHALKFTKV